MLFEGLLSLAAHRLASPICETVPLRFVGVATGREHGFYFAMTGAYGIQTKDAWDREKRAKKDEKWWRREDIYTTRHRQQEASPKDHRYAPM